MRTVVVEQARRLRGRDDPVGPAVRPGRGDHVLLGTGQTQCVGHRPLDAQAVVVQVAEGRDRRDRRREVALGHPGCDGVGARAEVERVVRTREHGDACERELLAEVERDTGALGVAHRHDLGPVELAAAVLRRLDAVTAGPVLELGPVVEREALDEVVDQLDQAVHDRVRGRHADRRVVGRVAVGVTDARAEDDLAAELAMAVGPRRDRGVRARRLGAHPRGVAEPDDVVAVGRQLVAHAGQRARAGTGAVEEHDQSVARCARGGDREVRVERIARDRRVGRVRRDLGVAEASFAARPRLRGAGGGEQCHRSEDERNGATRVLLSCHGASPSRRAPVRTGL